MATFDFSSITRTSEFTNIYNYIHAYNKYLRENPGADQATVKAHLTSNGFNPMYLDRAKALYSGIVPPIDKEQNMVQEFKSFVEAKESSIDTKYKDAEKKYEDPSSGIDGKSLKEIEDDGLDAKQELAKCRAGRLGVYAAIIAAAAFIAAPFLLSGLAAMAGGALAVPAFVSNAVVLGTLGGGVFLGHKASKGLFGEKIKEAKEKLKRYKRNKQRIENAKNEKDASKRELDNLKTNFADYEKVESMHNTNVNADIDEIGNRLRTMEARMTAELSACTPTPGEIGYAEAQKRKAVAEDELSKVRSAISDYNTARSANSMNIGTYNGYLQNALKAESEFNSHDVSMIVENSRDAQIDVIKNVEGIKDVFDEEVKDVQEIIDAGISPLSTNLQKVVNDTSKKLTDRKFEVHTQSATKTNEELVQGCEKLTRDIELTYKTAIAEAWKSYAESRMDAIVATADSARLDDVVKGEYANERQELDTVISLIEGIKVEAKSDADKRLECEKYLVVAEVKTALLRAYAQLANLDNVADATKVAEVSTIIAEIKNIDTKMMALPPTISHEEASKKAKECTKKLGAIKTGERTFTVAGVGVVKESELDAKISEYENTVKSGLTNVDTLYADLATKSEPDYSANKSKLQTAINDLVVGRGILEELCETKKLADTNYSVSASISALLADVDNRKDRGLPPVAEKVVVVDGVTYKKEELENAIQELATASPNSVDKLLADVKNHRESVLLTKTGEDYVAELAVRKEKLGDSTKGLNGSVEKLQRLVGAMSSDGASGFGDKSSVASAQSIIDASNAEISEPVKDSRYVVERSVYTEGQVQEQINAYLDEMNDALVAEQKAYDEMIETHNSEKNDEYKAKKSERDDLATAVLYSANMLEKFNVAYKNDPNLSAKITKAKSQASNIVEIEGAKPFRESELDDILEVARAELDGAINDEEEALEEAIQIWNDSIVGIRRPEDFNVIKEAHNNIAKTLAEKAGVFKAILDKKGEISAEDQSLLTEAYEKAHELFYTKDVAPVRANETELKTLLDKELGQLEKTEQLQVDNFYDLTDLTCDYKDKKFVDAKAKLSMSSDELKKACDRMESVCDEIERIASDKETTGRGLQTYRETIQRARENANKELVEIEGLKPFPVENMGAEIVSAVQSVQDSITKVKSAKDDNEKESLIEELRKANERLAGLLVKVEASSKNREKYVKELTVFDTAYGIVKGHKAEKQSIEERKIQIENMVSSVERYNAVAQSQKLEDRRNHIGYGLELGKVLVDNIGDEVVDAKLKARGEKALKQLNVIYKETSIDESKLLGPANENKETKEEKVGFESVVSEMSLNDILKDIMNAESGLSELERKAVREFAEKKASEKQTSEENSGTEVARETAETQKKTKPSKTAAREMLDTVLGLEEFDKIKEKPKNEFDLDSTLAELEESRSKVKAMQDKKAPSFEYVGSKEVEVDLSQDVSDGSTLKFEYIDPVKESKAMIKRANDFKVQLEQHGDAINGMSGINVTNIQVNVTNIINVLGQVDEKTPIEVVEEYEHQLESAIRDVEGAMQEYNRRLELLKKKVSAIKKDLELNGRPFEAYGVDTSVKLGTISKAEKVLDVLKKSGSANALIELESLINGFEQDIKATVNAKRPKESKAKASGTGVNETAAKCLLEGAILEYSMHDKLAQKISHESNVGGALLDTMVIKASETILKDNENYSVVRSGKDVSYEVSHEDVIREGRHKDSDIVKLDYLGKAIANSASYIASDRERRDDTRIRRGLEPVRINGGAGQVAIRNEIIDTFNKQILEKEGKKLTLQFEGKKPVVKVEGGELTYAELRKLDKIIEGQMFTESGKLKGNVVSNESQM